MKRSLTRSDPIRPPQPANAQPPVSGHHWLLDLSHCQAESHLLEEVSALEVLLPAAATAAGMHVVGQVFHQFHPCGVTGAVILSESHLTVHTWPESSFVALDVYVCDYNENNRQKGEQLAQAMIDLFKPLRSSFQSVQRSSTQLVSPTERHLPQ